jgi:hypothetical protein
LEIYEYRLPLGTNIHMKYMILRIILSRCHTTIRAVKQNFKANFKIS